MLAIESLTAIADSLKAAKPALLAQLGAAGMAKEVEGYFSRTVDAALDLRDAIYRGGARQLLSVRRPRCLCCRCMWTAQYMLFSSSVRQLKRHASCALPELEFKRQALQVK